MFNVAKSPRFAYNNFMKTAQKAADLLTSNGKTLSLAESCTGGLLSNIITDIPGSSKFFKGAVVSYSNDVKSNILKVPHSILEKYGAVSAPCVREMANGARRILKTNFSIAISGIAGPSGGTKEKPVGLTFIGIASANKIHIKRFIFQGSRLSVKKQTAEKALQLFIKFLHGSK